MSAPDFDTAPERLRWRRRILSVLPKQDWIAIGWILGIKLLLLVLGVESFQILSNQRIISARGWLEIWNRWDSLHYLKLAEFGYSSTDPMKAWLYPLSPWTVRGCAWVTRDYLMAAFGFLKLLHANAEVILQSDFTRNPWSPEIARRLAQDWVLARSKIE